jgi:hypothetical protein
MGWHTQTLAESALEVPDAYAREGGEFVQCDRPPEVVFDVIPDKLQAVRG